MNETTCTWTDKVRRNKYSSRCNLYKHEEFQIDNGALSSKKNEPQNPMKTLKEFVNSNIPAACNS